MCVWISVSKTKDVSKMKEWHFEYTRLWLIFQFADTDSGLILG